MPRSRAAKGAIGLPLWAGRLSLDQNTRLRWPMAGLVYREMMDNSPPVAALWTAFRTLMRTDAQVVPGGSTDADKTAAEGVESALGDMKDPLPTYMHQLGGGAFYGFCVMETVHKRRPDGLVGWASWGLRRQETLFRWETDKNGNVAGFTQRPPPDYRQATIWFAPSGRPPGAGTGMHLVADDSDGSPEGRALLRPMYRYWFMTTQIELLAGIALERFGTGIPVFSRVDSSPAVKLTAAQENALAAIAASLRQNEEAYVLEPPGIKFRFEPSPGIEAKTYLDFIQRYSVWMLASALAEFVALGTGESSGSRALGGNKIDLFLQSLTGFQDRVCEVISRQAIEPLCRYNGWIPGQGGITDYPRVTLPAAKAYDLDKLGSFVQVLNSAGAFHPTPEDEEWLRKTGDLMKVDIDTLHKLHEEGKEQAAAIARGRADEDESEDMRDDDVEETEEKGDDGEEI